MLSHAHMDHCGNLPNLVRQGFPGPIYCTPATRDLAAVMLADSAKHPGRGRRTSPSVIAARHASREVEPLYTRRDVHRTIEQMRRRRRTTSLRRSTPTCKCRFVDAGHMLGSAMVGADVLHGGRTYALTFTGDLGRRGLPFLRDPSPVPPADLIISESTYGGRTHDTVEVMADKMAEVVRRTVGRGGKVLIPAFSLGRTQVVLYFLRRWMRDGRAAAAAAVRG